MCVSTEPNVQCKIWRPGSESPVPAKYGIRGLHAVSILVRNLEPTALLLTKALGFRQVGEYPSPEDPARTVTVFAAADAGLLAETRACAEKPMREELQG